MKNLLILWLIILIACSQQPSDEQMKLTRHRLQKDSLFIHADWSPLLPDDKADFGGLNYFPLAEDLSFSGQIKMYDKPDTTQIYATKEGDIRPAVAIGYFPFEFEGVSYQLQIFKLFSKKDPQQSFLFLGFTDATTGNETYGAGRYIELEENPENFYEVNFNYAYNPYCAYNAKYSCALPPAANRLPFAVTAGEKIYRVH